MAEQPRIRDADIIAIGQFMFDAFCEEKHIPEEDRPGMSPKYFIQWLPEFCDRYTPETLHDAIPVPVSYTAAEYMMSIPHLRNGISAIVAMWPFFTLARRPHQNKVRSLNILSIVQFEDGVIVPINMLAHKDVVDEELDDARVCHLIVTRTSDIASQIALSGLDSLHDRHAFNYKGMADKDTVDRLRVLIGQAPDYAVSEYERGKLHKLVAFIEQLFPQDIPKPIQEKIEAAAQPPASGFNQP